MIYCDNWFLLKKILLVLYARFNCPTLTKRNKYGLKLVWKVVVILTSQHFDDKTMKKKLTVWKTNRTHILKLHHPPTSFLASLQEKFGIIGGQGQDEVIGQLRTSTLLCAVMVLCKLQHHIFSRPNHVRWYILYTKLSTRHIYPFIQKDLLTLGLLAGRATLNIWLCSMFQKILSFLPHIYCWHTHPDESIFSNLPKWQEA